MGFNLFLKTIQAETKHAGIFFTLIWGLLAGRQLFKLSNLTKHHQNRFKFNYAVKHTTQTKQNPKKEKIKWKEKKFGKILTSRRSHC